MSKEKMCELAVILADLEDTIKNMYLSKEWLTTSEMAACLDMCQTSVNVYLNRPAFTQYVRNFDKGIRIKNCPESLKLMRCYKYRNFKYEEELLKKKEKALNK